MTLYFRSLIFGNGYLHGMKFCQSQVYITCLLPVEEKEQEHVKFLTVGGTDYYALFALYIYFFDAHEPWWFVTGITWTQFYLKIFWGDKYIYLFMYDPNPKHLFLTHLPFFIFMQNVSFYKRSSGKAGDLIYFPFTFLVGI